MNATMYAYQKTGFDWLCSRNNGALFFETGTGKTLVALFVMTEWHARGYKLFYVIVPNSATGVWLGEARKWGFSLKIERLEGDHDARIKQIASNSWDVLVFNYETLRSKTILNALLARKPCGLIYDEMQRLKNRRAVQTIMSREIAREVQLNGGAVCGLTGTPVTHSPLDLWSEFDLLRPKENPKDHLLNYGSYQSFENKIAIVKAHPRLPHVKLYDFPDDRLAELKERVSKLAIEASKAEFLDLPERRFQIVTLEMVGEQKRIYKELSDDYIATLEGVITPVKILKTLPGIGVKALTANEKAMEVYKQIESSNDGALYAEPDHRVSVAFANTLMIRLQQLAAGHIKADDGVLHYLKGCKEEWLLENLPAFTSKGWGHKTVIFCRFVADVLIIERVCEELAIGFVSLTGKTSKQASALVERFQTDSRVRVFIGNLAVASTSITLTAADRVIFYTNSFAWGDRSQAQDRTYRIGQTKIVEYYDLCADKSVDEDVLKNIEEKTDLVVKTVKGLLKILKKEA